MALGRRKQQPEHDESVTNVLARLDAVVDRLEGVYDRLTPLLDQAHAANDQEGPHDRS